eukprot:COSAG02_NODE_54972_length_293_cov_0.778351_1_plen_97_part_11
MAKPRRRRLGYQNGADSPPAMPCRRRTLLLMQMLPGKSTAPHGAAATARGGGQEQGEGEGAPASVQRDWQQRVFIEKVVAMEEKHMFVCSLQPLQDG